MMRLLLALMAAAIASGCQSATSSKAGSDLLLIAVKSADDVASTDCEAPRTVFEPTRAHGQARVSLAGSRLTAVALVHRRTRPRRPHVVVGALTTSVASDSPCLTDLIQELRGRAVAEGCDAVVVGDEVTTADGRTRLDGSCLVFVR